MNQVIINACVYDAAYMYFAIITFSHIL